MIWNLLQFTSLEYLHIGFGTNFEGIYMFEEPQLLLDKAETLKWSVYTKQSFALFTLLNEVFYCRFILTVLYDKYVQIWTSFQRMKILNHFIYFKKKILLNLNFTLISRAQIQGN